MTWYMWFILIYTLIGTVWGLRVVSTEDTSPFPNVVAVCIIAIVWLPLWIDKYGMDLLKKLNKNTK